MSDFPKEKKVQGSQQYNLSDFELQDKIGHGNFGKVYKSILKKTREICAAKISKNMIEDPTIDDIRDISREVNIISKLNHPSVLKFIFYSPFNFKNKPKPVIITEFATNKALYDLIQNERIFPSGRFTDTLKLILIYGISSAMSYLHSNDIIHRDLKPENILLDDYLFPKIGDFGLSKVNDHQTRDNSIMQTIGPVLKGTPKYMAPEIWSKCEYSKASDVYAFGMIVYEIITNQKIFEDIEYQIVLSYKVSNGHRPEINSKVPDSYSSLIERCWSQDPKKRPTFDEILNELKTDRGYITETINEKDFFNYVNYIDKCDISFDPSKVPFHLEDFYKKAKNQQNQSVSNFDNINIRFVPYKVYTKLDENCKILVDAAKNDPEKMFVIGKSFVEGRDNFPQNTEVGLSYLTQSLYKDCIDSLVYYCEMLIKGKFVPQELNLARELLQLRLTNNEELSSLLTGKIFKKEKNYINAESNFLKSIEFGNAEAMYEYAMMIYKGLCSSRNKEEAIKYFEKSIEKGFLKAMFKYGSILKEENEGLKKKGIELIKTAADGGYPKAMYCYSSILDEKGLEKESMMYLKNAANCGLLDAMHEYALKLGNYGYKPIILTLDKSTKIESRNFLKKASKQGHIEATYQYSMIQLKGDGVPRNNKKGIKYLHYAAYGGSSDAMALYGDILFTGNGVPVDKKEGLRLINLAAEKGNSKALFLLGFMFQYGNGVNKDIKEALNYYKMAVDKGNIDAMSNYAYLIQSIDPEEAVKYYKIAIDKNCLPAMHNYAVMLFKGEGIKSNKKEAIKYLKIAAEKGSVKSMVEYANILLYGDGIDSPNPKEAAKLFQTAINKGNTDAMIFYGTMLFEGNGIPMNKKEGLKYFKMAADSGDDSNMFHYASIIEDSDKEEAIKYYKMAIDKGNLDAMNSYGAMFYNGDGVPLDKEKAIELFKRAADNGHVQSMYNYAYCLHELNENDERCNKECLKYFKMAADKGHVTAINNYAYFLSEGIGCDADKKESAKYFQMAADKGNINAIITYAYMLETGDGIPIDQVEALDYYQVAAFRGHPFGIQKYNQLKRQKHLLREVKDMDHFNAILEEEDSDDDDDDA